MMQCSVELCGQQMGTGHLLHRDGTAVLSTEATFTNMCG